jgi:urease accessory protein UreH
VGKNHLGSPRFTDTVKLEPKNENIKVEVILGTFKVVGTIYVVTKESYVKDLQYEISEKIKAFEVKGKISGGTSILPARQGIIVRILGNSAEDVKKITFEVVSIARKKIVGAPFSGIRKA